MCGSSKGYKAPKIVAAAPAAAPMVAAIEADETVAMAGDEERKRRRAAYGFSNTVLTGGLGDTRAPVTAGKQLLGQ